jgi:outer membrane protein assembly factor BamB
LDLLDKDVGSGGVVLLPDQSSGPPHLLVAGGKEGKLYLVNRDSMGHFCGSCTATTGDTNILQSFAATNALFATAAFWQNGLYLGGVLDSLKLFLFDPSTGKLNTSAASQSTTIFAFPGSTPSISSQRASNGIVWAIDSSQLGVPRNAGGPAVLHAYDATNLAIELWNSSQAANNRDQAGLAVKFTVPTVANGKVYIGTRSTIEVYGLLPN